MVGDVRPSSHDSSRIIELMSGLSEYASTLRSFAGHFLSRARGLSDGLGLNACKQRPCSAWRATNLKRRQDERERWTRWGDGAPRIAHGEGLALLTLLTPRACSYFDG